MRTKKEKKRLFFISFIIVGLVFLLGFSVYKDFIIISNNKNQTTKLNQVVKHFAFYVILVL